MSSESDSRCQQLREQVGSSPDLSVPAGEVDAHLRTCSGCAAWLTQTRGVLDRLASTPTPALPEGFWQSLTERLRFATNAAGMSVKAHGKAVPLAQAEEVNEAQMPFLLAAADEDDDQHARSGHGQGQGGHDQDGMDPEDPQEESGDMHGGDVHGGDVHGGAGEMKGGCGMMGMGDESDTMHGDHMGGGDDGDHMGGSNDDGGMMGGGNDDGGHMGGSSDDGHMSD